MLRCWLPLAILCAPACAREPEAPPAVGEVCESDADCNPRHAAGELGCGFQRLCVAGRCEIATDAAPGSRLVIFCDAGAPATDDTDGGD